MANIYSKASQSLIYLAYSIVCLSSIIQAQGQPPLHPYSLSVLNEPIPNRIPANFESSSSGALISKIKRAVPTLEAQDTVGQGAFLPLGKTKRGITHYIRPASKDYLQYLHVPNIDCTQGELRAPHPDFCNEFIECDHQNHIVIKKCGPLQVYIDEIKACGWPQSSRRPVQRTCGTYTECTGKSYEEKRCPGKQYFDAESRKCLDDPERECTKMITTSMPMNSNIPSFKTTTATSTVMTTQRPTITTTTRVPTVTTAARRPTVTTTTKRPTRRTTTRRPSTKATSRRPTTTRTPSRPTTTTITATPTMTTTAVVPILTTTTGAPAKTTTTTPATTTTIKPTTTATTTPATTTTTTPATTTTIKPTTTATTTPATTTTTTPATTTTIKPTTTATTTPATTTTTTATTTIKPTTTATTTPTTTTTSPATTTTTTTATTTTTKPTTTATTTPAMTTTTSPATTTTTSTTTTKPTSTTTIIPTTSTLLDYDTGIGNIISK